MAEQPNRRMTAPPLMTCNPGLARALGAIRLSHPSDAKQFAPAFIPVRASDGSLWAWPIESSFRDAILRR